MTGIEFVARHFWIVSRIPFRQIDPRTGAARLQWKSRMRLTDDHGQQGALYYVENVFEALDQPGQWYHDRRRRQWYYLPRPAERIATSEIVVPRLNQLVLATGAEHLAFDGLTFSHSEWVPGRERFTATPQAPVIFPARSSFTVPGSARCGTARWCTSAATALKWATARAT